MLKIRKKYVLPLLIITFAIVAVAFSFKLRLNQFGPGDTSLDDAEASVETQKPAINGSLVAAETADTRPLAVMVENHTDSRPQSGLAEADIVYEVLAEGGITRFLAVYQTSEAKNIGPVRSARDYFASIANEYSALYAHVGGSDEVLAQLKNGTYKNVTDLSEYYNGDYFQRIKSRPAPHNTYTSTKELRRYLTDEEISMPERWTDWNFTDSQDTNSIKNAAVLTVDFSTPAYKVGYVLDSEQKLYKRLQADSPHLDATTKQQLTAKTVIVQFVDVEAIAGDDKDRIDIDLIGEGDALIFHDGLVTKSRWNKTNSSRTTFSDLAGKPIEFNRGKIWIELVQNDDPTGRVTWKPANTTY